MELVEARAQAEQLHKRGRMVALHTSLEPSAPDDEPCPPAVDDAAGLPSLVPAEVPSQAVALAPAKKPPPKPVVRKTIVERMVEDLCKDLKHLPSNFKRLEGDRYTPAL